MRRVASIVLSACSLLAAIGCGAATPSAPKADGPTAVSYPAVGIAFTAPAGWSVTRGRGRLVATVRAGEATIAIWRFPSREELPASKDELRAARDALLTATTARDGATFSVIKAGPATVGDRPAVQYRAKATIAGRPRLVRATHIYADRAEIVIDAYAEYDHFRSIDSTVFRPLLKTLHVTTPQRASAPREASAPSGAS
jgi:hypothetical protein